MRELADIRQESLEWLYKFHGVGDSLNVNNMDQAYAKDAVLKFNNYEFKGLDAIRNFFEEQFLKLQSMKHTIIHFDTIGDTIYQAADITYVVKGDPVAVPIKVHGMANCFRKPMGVEEGGKLARCEVYLDPSPLVKRTEEVTALNAQ